MGHLMRNLFLAVAPFGKALFVPASTTFRPNFSFPDFDLRFQISPLNFRKRRHVPRPSPPASLVPLLDGPFFFLPVIGFF